MPGHPMAPLGNFGPHRQLHEIHLEQRPVHQRQFQRMHHILAIMQDDAMKPLALPLLVGAQGGIDAVEAIGLGGGAITIMDHHAQARIMLHRLGHRRHRGRIIAIASHIQHVIGFAPCREHLGDGGADHLGFLPASDENGDPAMQPIHSRIARQQWGAVFAVHPQAKPQRIDDQFVHHPDQQPEQGKEQQFPLEQQQPFG